MLIQFLGATGTVTGSKYLVSVGSRRILIDCGLFEGLKQLRLRNWERPLVEPREVDAIILTHAHLDHSGYLPLFAKRGFKGPVYCTHATEDLCRILLPDSGYLQEEEAEYANRRASRNILPRSRSIHCEMPRLAWARCCQSPTMRLSTSEMDCTFVCAGRPYPGGGDGHARVRWNYAAVLWGPRAPGGPRDCRARAGHARRLPRARVDLRRQTAQCHRSESRLGEIVNRTVARGGSVIIPAFAVGRAQEILYYLHRLKDEGTIPDVPVYLNSPMAADVTALYQKFEGQHRLSAVECDATCKTARIVNTVEESEWLNTHTLPMVVISASGMATGGAFFTICAHLRQIRGTPSCSPASRQREHEARQCLPSHRGQDSRTICSDSCRSRIAAESIGACGLRRNPCVAAQFREGAPPDLPHTRRAGSGGCVATSHRGRIPLAVSGTGLPGVVRILVSVASDGMRLGVCHGPVSRDMRRHPVRGWGRSKRSPAYVRLHTHSIADMLLGSRCPYVVLAEGIIGKQVRVSLDS